MNNHNSSPPKISVLLAAYNGEKFIEEQVKSIINQIGVHVDIFISLDRSTDSSLNIIKDLCDKHENVHLLNYGERFGNAGKNFYHLIKSIDFSQYDFVAFSDQDDIWFPEKLLTATEKIRIFSYDAYSSDVIAFWPENNKKLTIKKSFPQKKMDYIFEAAGPGCTYVLTINTASSFKDFIQENPEKTELIQLHDWYIYAYCRARKLNWHIDNIPKMLYRQHSANLVGANNGFKAIKKRISAILDNTWIKQCFTIYQATKTESFPFLENINDHPRKAFFYLFSHSREFRRNQKESFYLKIFFIYYSIFPPKV